MTDILTSGREHDEYVRLKSLVTQALWAHELSLESLQALVEARVDPRHDHLNALMDK